MTNNTRAMGGTSSMSTRGPHDPYGDYSSQSRQSEGAMGANIRIGANHYSEEKHQEQDSGCC